MKTSSLGDVIHNLPVISDIRRHFPQAQIDWCVEESFSAIPRLHPGVGRVIPVAVRRWRKKLLQAATWREMAEFRRQLASETYDAIIDTQGLLKSALIASRAKGPRLGYAADAAREPAAARWYNRHFHVSRDLHAVIRNRRLVAAALGYQIEGEPDYGIETPPASFSWLPHRPYAVFLTATSRDDKLWPEANWLTLGRSLNSQGFSAVLPGGSALERERAARLAAAIPGALAAPPMSISELASLLSGARAAVGVDTGLTHLAVALKTPTVAIYTATDPGLTGVLGAGFHRNLGGKAQTPSADAVLGELQGVLT
ncbi:lipopolysaccharide heptosyltransferase I [Dechloromonas sp. CZR5]|uniref:lipopolysaccharide heptosyltransferase I n=1 Tax=Dechloromonas sp. CZR5 TaxID=2608630 RepID=UPI00210362F9|nr:lipopolysaccharide heptosyltransferase I [Dechloromonas sp. CZR5]